MTALHWRSRLSMLVAALLVAGCAATPSPTATGSGTPSAPPATAQPSPGRCPPGTTCATPVGTPAPATSVGPSPSAAARPSEPPAVRSFVTPAPPATWASLDWHRLAPDDPLALVRSVVRWHGGYVAVGWDGTTPLWTSVDGARWDLLPVDTATSFWPGQLVIGVAPLSDGLEAFTMGAGSNSCGGDILCQSFDPPLMEWASSDGRTWRPHGAGDLTFPLGPETPAPMLAAGPHGLLIVSGAGTVPAVMSANGRSWRAVATSAMPGNLRIAGLAATASGYVLVATQTLGPAVFRAVALTSPDGRTWSSPTPLPWAATAGATASSGADWGVDRLVAGSSGMIADGRFIATPGAALWWQSATGTTWRLLPAYPPLGPTTCTGAGCGGQPDGLLVGDGRQMLALRGGPPSAAAWTSGDGVRWHALSVAGDVPPPAATQDGAPYISALLPGGVVVSDGTNAWYASTGG
jgi:hypothetical protein